MEPVHEEDRPIVRNVVAAIQAIKRDKILSSWNVTLVQGGYLVTAFINDGVDFEFNTKELQLIHDVSPLRVMFAGVARQASKMCLRVKISDRNEPLMITETEVLLVRKRSRWGM